MEKLLKSERPFNKEFFQKVARSFNSSSGRAGKPIVKWTEVQSWFQQRQHDLPYKESSVRGSEDDSLLPKSIPLNEVQGKLSQLEFEARSSKDGAWYDVDLFLSHRVVTPGESEVRVRFVGFGPEEDEWVNIRNDVRERSIPLEPSECQNVKVGDLVCCFQERRDQAIYYDAHVVDIQRKTHDIRGCRCIFLVQYDHDGTEERIRLRRICRRPN